MIQIGGRYLKMKKKGAYTKISCNKIDELFKYEVYVGIVCVIKERVAISVIRVRIIC